MTIYLSQRSISAGEAASQQSAPEIARRQTEHGSGLGRLRWVVERAFAWLQTSSDCSSAIGTTSPVLVPPGRAAAHAGAGDLPNDQRRPHPAGAVVAER